MNPLLPPAIQTVELSKQYETHTGSPRLALDRVSLVVPAGQVAGVLGKSGSGKTTLLRLLSGREKASSGQVWITGKPAPAGEVRACLQGDAPLAPGLSLELALRLAAPGWEDRADLLPVLGLQEWRTAGIQSLPGAAQNRAALARALLADAPVILLDELPGLDIETARALQSWLPDWAHSQDRTLLLATRLPEIALALCDRILVLRDGQLALDTRVHGCAHAADDGPAVYQILLRGRLDPARSSWFAGMEVTWEGGDTRIWGDVQDQPALHGLLARVRDLGLPLISLRRMDPPPEQRLRDWM